MRYTVFRVGLDPSEKSVTHIYFNIVNRRMRGGRLRYNPIPVIFLFMRQLEMI